MRTKKSKEKELISRINELGKEIGAPLAFNIKTKEQLKIKGKNEKEKNYLESIKNYKDYLISQEKNYSFLREDIESLDKQIKEINKKSLRINKDFQKKMFSLKEEEVNLNEKIKILEKKLGIYEEDKMKEVKPLSNSLRESINTKIGATMPYIRYDSDEAILGGGAILVTSPDHSQENIASQASKQSYVKLPESGSYVEWTMHSVGNGVTMRFTMPDTEDGMGQNGSLDLYVNGNKVKTINLTSYYCVDHDFNPLLNF